MENQMPVQSNPAIQNVPSIAWDGTAAFSTDIRPFIRFGWSFQIAGAIAVNAVFRVQAAPPSLVNNCLPGTCVAVLAPPMCDENLLPGALATVTIPAGTPIGSICSATIPCRPDAFVRLAAVSGSPVNVRAILIRQGPRF